MTKWTTLPSGVFSIIIFLLFFQNALYAQVGLSDRGDKANFYTGISPVILPKDGIEVNFLNSMTSFWVAATQIDFANGSSRVANRYRFTRLQHLLRVNYGFSSSNRWDLGAELLYTHSRLDDEARSSPFRVLGDGTGSGNSYRGVSQLGMRFRFMPFGEVRELTVQAMAHFPINPKDSLRQQLGAQRVQVGLLATFYQQFNSRTYYFLQADWRTHLANDELDKTTHTPSASGFLVFDVWEGWYVFPGITYAPTFQKLTGGSFRRVNQQLLGSLGVLFQPAENFGIMLNWQVPFILESGSRYAEWVRESFTGATLGIRVVL